MSDAGKTVGQHDSPRDLAAWILEQAKKAGADNCRVSVEQSRQVEISCRQGKLESLKEATERSVQIELYVAGRYAVQATSDLRRDSLLKFLSDSMAMTRLLDEDPHQTLPDPKYCQDRTKGALGVRDKAHESLTSSKRRDAAMEMERACRERGGKHSVSASSSVSDRISNKVLMASNGVEGTHESTRYSFGCDLTVKDEGDRRPCGGVWGTASCEKDLPAPARAGEMAADEALAMRGAKKLKTETLPVMVRNRTAGQVVGWLLSPMYGVNVQQKRSWLADLRGKQIGSAKLTIVDDPLLPGGVGSCAFDSEGMTARRRVMVEEGVLRDFYLGWYYSRKLGMEPTIATTTNLLVPPGARSPEQILKDLGRCLVVSEFIGGNANSTTGDFSVGIVGTMYEKGEPVQAVAEMNMAGSSKELWNRLVETANDPWIYSSQRTPSMLFDNVVVSGA